VHVTTTLAPTPWIQIAAQPDTITPSMERIGT